MGRRSYGRAASITVPLSSERKTDNVYVHSGVLIEAPISVYVERFSRPGSRTNPAQTQEMTDAGSRHSVDGITLALVTDVTEDRIEIPFTNVVPVNTTTSELSISPSFLWRSSQRHQVPTAHRGYLQQGRLEQVRLSPTSRCYSRGREQRFRVTYDAPLSNVNGDVPP